MGAVWGQSSVPVGAVSPQRWDLGTPLQGGEGDLDLANTLLVPPKVKCKEILFFLQP